MAVERQREGGSAAAAGSPPLPSRPHRAGPPSWRHM